MVTSHPEGLNSVKSVESILNFWFYLGLYRKDHISKTKYWLYSLLLHIPFTYLYAISVLFSSFDLNDLNILTKILCTNITVVIYIVKVVVLQYDLGDLTEMLIIRRRIESSTRIFFSWCILYVVTTILYAAKTLVNSNELIFNVILPYDWKKSAIIFWVTFCCQFCGLIFQVLITATVDSFLASILCTLGGYCDALSYTFTKIDRFIGNGIEEQFFKEMTIKYTHICKLTKMVEELYSMIIVCQFSLSLGVLCTTLFQISLAPPQNILNYLAMCLYMLSIFIEIAVPCYFGDEIYTKSDNLLYSLYAGNWMGLKPNMKKNVIILMQFFNHPLQIRAGSLVTLKIETVNSIIQKAYSFYAVLQGMTGKSN